MKKGIHPKYEAMSATCTCGATHEFKSTLTKQIHLDICSSCHPFYTGKQKEASTGGRVDRFKKRFTARTAR